MIFSLSNIIKFFMLFAFLVVLVGCAEMAALDPLSGSDSRRNDPNKINSLTLANYHLQKKYDLLYRGLQKEYTKNKYDKMMIGQLFSTIDLAEFYTYGFINYKKSLALLDEAKTLNQKINDLGHTVDYRKSSKLYDDVEDLGDSDREPSNTDNSSAGEIVTYYLTSGKYAIPRSYDYNKIASQICSVFRRINRIYRYNPGDEVQDVDLPKITPLITDNYAFAIQVERDIISSDYFDQFEEKLTSVTREYFKHRYKLPQSDHNYYINFNILRGLTSVFDFTSLSRKQIEIIFTYLKNSKNDKHKDSNKLLDTFVDYVEILCLSEMGEYEKALLAFDKFNDKIKKINQELDDYLDYLQTARNKAVAVATAKTVGFIALTVLTMGRTASSGGVNYGINLGPAGFFDFAGSVATTQQRLNFTGESTYAKQMNILLNMDDQLQLYRAVGKSYHKIGNLEKSIVFNKEAVAIIANLRSTITTEKGRVNFAGYRDEIYSYLIEDLFRSEKYAEAFYYTENSRARSLVDLLGSKQDLSLGDINTNSYVKEIKDIQIYRDQLRKNVAISGQQVEYLNKLEEELEKEFNRKTNRGLKEVAIESTKNKNQHSKKLNIDHKTSIKEIINLVTVSNLDYREVQNILPEDSTLVEYFVSNNKIYAWILEKNKFTPISLSVDQVSLKDEILHFIKAIKFSKHKDPAFLAKMSKSIYDKLFQPLECHITNKLIYLVNHDFLHSLPFDALFTGEDFLVNRYSFSRLPSASVMQFLEPIGKSQKSLLVFGNPEVSGTLKLPNLPGAEREAQSISTLFTDKKILIKGEATESSFRKESGAFTFTHIASHGFFDENDAMNSKLFMASDDQNDGQLTASELYEIPQVSDMIILSACETARVEISKGDELLGLMRGFFFSGASSLVASLWTVDDLGTLKLMENFYNYMINENQSPQIVLKKAKHDMIKSKKFNSPYYWAPFNLYGLGI